MKKTVIALAMMAMSATALRAQTSSTEVKTSATATISAGKFDFKEDSFDFGEVAEGPDVSHNFEFTNTGKKPIFIRNASAGCGCTVAEWPHEPVLPGAKASIKVTFHSKGRPGAVSKVVSIASDAEQQNMSLRITGNVKSAEIVTPTTATTAANH
jgi:hypothetical protein